MLSEFILYSSAAIFLYMTCVFVLALLKKDNSIVDVAWGTGFLLVALLTFFMDSAFTFRSALVTGLVIFWGSRLALHIYFRNRGKGEDFRYAKWRKEWGKTFVWRSYFQIFMLQGLLLLIIAYPIILVNQSEEGGFTALDIAGMAVWMVGFFFEAVGDYQLRAFKKNPENRGKIISRGLWRYTRHPNYFGEVTCWWGIFLIALSIEWGWTAVISPLAITFLLLRVSGVTMLEKKYEGNQAYEEYARKTSPFIPWFPKR
jgi:steroid 5-alpha reductase family enzyme